jgi:hypothetical protein
MNVDFAPYFDKQEKAHREVLYQLHEAVGRSAEGITARPIWGQPFYYYRGEWFGYLSYVKKWKCVELGFTKGYLLEDPYSILLSRNRTQVRSIAFYTTSDFTSREEAVLETIQRALMLNEKA